MQATLPSARRIDRYELVAPIGEGGFGSVFKARHIHAGHFVALKLVRDDGQGGVARLLREARALAEIQHPNVVRVFDCGIAEGEAFVAMELVEGQDLGKLLEQGPIAPQRAIHITRQLLEGLGVVHARGIVHRDVKPANISIGPGDHVKLLDFGISKSRTMDTQVTHTRPGMTIGTPGYMAPEQLGATVEVDARADVYAVAATLYEMLSGRRPHDAPSYEDYVVKVRTERPAPLASIAPHVPPALADVVDRGLARDRDARWPNVATFAEALNAAMTGVPLSMVPPTFSSAPPQMLPSAPRTARTPPPPAPVKARSTLPIVLAILGGLALVIGFGAVVTAFFFTRTRAPDPTPVAASATATATATAPAPAAVSATAPAAVSAPASVPVPVPVPAAASTSPHKTPAPVAPVGGVKVSAPRIVGKVPIAVLDDLVAKALPQLPVCRGAKAETVVIQVFVQDTGEISMVEPYVAENKGDVETSRCVATRFKAASETGWNSKGGQGIVRYTVTLDPK